MITTYIMSVDCHVCQPSFQQLEPNVQQLDKNMGLLHARLRKNVEPRHIGDFFQLLNTYINPPRGINLDEIEGLNLIQTSSCARILLSYVQITYQHSADDADKNYLQSVEHKLLHVLETMNPLFQVEIPTEEYGLEPTPADLDEVNS